MKSKIFTLALVGIFSTGSGMAQSDGPACVSLFSQAQSAFTQSLVLYQEFRKEAARKLLGDPMADIADLALDLQTDIYLAGGEVAGNGQTSLGPRNLLVPCKNITGTIVAGVGTERTFLTVPGGWDKTFITIKQTDGKSSAKISVCVKDVSGTRVNKKWKEIDGKGKEINFQFWDTEDKFLTIHIVKPLGMNNFSYSIEMRGEINMEKSDMKEYVEEIEAEEAKTPKSKPTSKIILPDGAKSTGKTTGKVTTLEKQVKPKAGLPKTGSTKPKTIDPNAVIEQKANTTSEEPSEEPTGETQEEMEERLQKEANQKAKEKAKAEKKRREEERRRQEKKEEMKQKAKQKAKEKHQSSGGN